jgi:hypothetical protein
MFIRDTFIEQPVYEFISNKQPVYEFISNKQPVYADIHISELRDESNQCFRINVSDQLTEFPPSRHTTLFLGLILVMTLNQQTLRNMPIQKSYFHDFG